ncbi:hypothetical protein GPJ56_006273 [Histomonas meleagridis]|uniref:uncharacterized protein n=1 Tax=Histomonas meleagridis TaxID=135588 RepID=UPI003559924D|nr:hypothetical protein GPJ56_006273 [Histomonas meleagridis]KAH0796911.1 hypothetical protein GO595_010804 [Histomonas meleagridis]
MQSYQTTINESYEFCYPPPQAIERTNDPKAKAFFSDGKKRIFDKNFLEIDNGQVFQATAELKFPHPQDYKSKEEFLDACFKWEKRALQNLPSLSLPQTPISSFYIPQPPSFVLKGTSEYRAFKPLESPLTPFNHAKMIESVLSGEPFDPEDPFPVQMQNRDVVRYNNQIASDQQWQSQLLPPEPMAFLYNSKEEFEKAYERWENIAYDNLQFPPIPYEDFEHLIGIDQMQSEALQKSKSHQTLHSEISNLPDFSWAQDIKFTKPEAPVNKQLSDLLEKSKNPHFSSEIPDCVTFGVNRDQFISDFIKFGYDSSSENSIFPHDATFQIPYDPNGEQILLNSFRYTLNYNSLKQLIDKLSIGFTQTQLNNILTQSLRFSSPFPLGEDEFMSLPFAEYHTQYDAFGRDKARSVFFASSSETFGQTTGIPHVSSFTFDKKKKISTKRKPVNSQMFKINSIFLDSDEINSTSSQPEVSDETSCSPKLNLEGLTPPSTIEQEQNENASTTATSLNLEGLALPSTIDELLPIEAPKKETKHRRKHSSEQKNEESNLEPSKRDNPRPTDRRTRSSRLRSFTKEEAPIIEVDSKSTSESPKQTSQRKRRHTRKHRSKDSMPIDILKTILTPENIVKILPTIRNNKEEFIRFSMILPKLMEAEFSLNFFNLIIQKSQIESLYEVTKLILVTSGINISLFKPSVDTQFNFEVSQLHLLSSIVSYQNNITGTLFMSLVIASCRKLSTSIIKSIDEHRDELWGSLKIDDNDKCNIMMMLSEIPSIRIITKLANNDFFNIANEITKYKNGRIFLLRFIYGCRGSTVSLISNGLKVENNFTQFMTLFLCLFLDSVFLYLIENNISIQDNVFMPLFDETVDAQLFSKVYVHACPILGRRELIYNFNDKAYQNNISNITMKIIQSNSPYLDIIKCIRNLCTVEICYNTFVKVKPFCELLASYLYPINDQQIQKKEFILSWKIIFLMLSHSPQSFVKFLEYDKVVESIESIAKKSTNPLMIRMFMTFLRKIWDNNSQLIHSSVERILTPIVGPIASMIRNGLKLENYTETLSAVKNFKDKALSVTSGILGNFGTQLAQHLGIELKKK